MTHVTPLLMMVKCDKTAARSRPVQRCMSHARQLQPVATLHYCCIITACSSGLGTAELTCSHSCSGQATAVVWALYKSQVRLARESQSPVLSLKTKVINSPSADSLPDKLSQKYQLTLNKVHF